VLEGEALVPSEARAHQNSASIGLEEKIRIGAMDRRSTRAEGADFPILIFDVSLTTFIS
jgi:hypothetical protein